MLHVIFPTHDFAQSQPHRVPTTLHLTPLVCILCGCKPTNFNPKQASMAQLLSFAVVYWIVIVTAYNCFWWKLCCSVCCVFIQYWRLYVQHKDLVLWLMERINAALSHYQQIVSSAVNWIFTSAKSVDRIIQKVVNKFRLNFLVGCDVWVATTD